MIDLGPYPIFTGMLLGLAIILLVIWAISEWRRAHDGWNHWWDSF